MAATVSVLMPVYNGEKYLQEAINSILNQTYSDFDFLIINDGSTDRTEEIILSNTDPRIQYIKNDTNLKLIGTLNKALSLVNGKYLARMDADDICTPDRLQKQLEAMEQNPNIGAVGCAMDIFGSNDNRVVRFDSDADYIKFRLLFGCYIVHGASLIRMSVLKENNITFNPDYVHCEDHYFFWQIANKSAIYNHPDVLYARRMHDESVIAVNAAYLKQKHNELRYDILAELGVTLTNAEKKAYGKFILKEFVYTLDSIETLMNVFDKIIEANKNSQLLNSPILFNYFISDCAINILNTNTQFGIKIYTIAKNNKSVQSLSNRTKFLTRLLIKSLIYKKKTNLQFSKYE